MPEFFSSQRPLLSGKRWMVTADHPLAVKGAASILQNGGDAVEALVAANLPDAFLYASIGIFGLAWGACLGALLHLLIQVPGLIYYKVRWQPLLSSAAIKYLSRYSSRHHS